MDLPKSMVKGIGFKAAILCRCHAFVMDMVIFRTIFFKLLVFFTFTLLTLHFAY